MFRDYEDHIDEAQPGNEDEEVQSERYFKDWADFNMKSIWGE